MNESQAADPKPYDERGYRPCVGIFLLNNENKLFVARRIDNKAEAWQMPQGGIEPGEIAGVACFREMQEEIGTKNAEVIRELDDWLSYDIPHDLADSLWDGVYRGQKQKWVALRFLGSDDEIDIETDEPEFNDWKWVAPREILGLAVPFKQKVYDQVLERFADIVN